MRLRIASIAFLLGSALTGLTWLTLQPTWIQLLELAGRAAVAGGPELQHLTRLRAALPWWLFLNLIASSAFGYLVLQLTVGRPLGRAEAAIDDLSLLDRSSPLTPSGGPLLSRLEGSLRRTSRALLREREVIDRQLGELVTANSQLAKTQTELASAEQLASVGKLAAGVAHEVGNPLSGILGYLSLARARAGSPELLELLDRIDHEVQRIDQIVRGLLDLGRPLTGKSGPVGVAAVIDTTAQLAAAGRDFEGVELVLDLDRQAVVKAEAGPLSQVLLNLLLNAAQSAGGGGHGKVQVRAWQEQASVHLAVEDNGPGIAPEIIPRLFEPFNTSKAAGKGTGLGLAVSRHLIHSMGGELSGANLGGGGARFLVVLPAA